MPGLLEAGKEDTTQDAKSDYANPLPSVNIPRGGGAIKGIDEKLGVNAVTGTASSTIAIPTTAGRAGFGPQLSLAYDSGSGNGMFGFGWQLQWPDIVRKTDKGLPLYDDECETDTFILSGAEDLVPLLNSTKKTKWEPSVQLREVGGCHYRIVQYRPRSEGAFSLVERWTDVSSKTSHWRTISGTNVTTVFGYDKHSRIYDPCDPSRVFRWLVSHTFDDIGNAMVFEYKSENADGVSLHDSNEANIDPCVRMTQRYPKKIKYGNLTSHLLNPRLESLNWMFEVVFDYGDHDEIAPSVKETRPWTVRGDPYSNRRPGFEIRTYRLCERVLMFHHFPDEPGVGVDCLVSSLDINYHTVPRIENFHSQDRQMIASCISLVSQSSYVKREGTYERATMPPIEYEYSVAETAHQICDLQAQVLDNIQGGIDGAFHFFIDLDGEGIPGILTSQGDSFYYSANEGFGRFAAPRTLQFEPSSFKGGKSADQWIDLSGDGQIDLVQLQGPLPGFARRERHSPFDWSNFKPFKSFPNIDLSSPDVRMIDLTGDGHSDVLLIDDELFTWYESWAEEGFAPAMTKFKPMNEEDGPKVVYNDGVETIQLADMTGDGLSDLVRIRNGEICYWANLGRGKFGSKVAMRNAPFFDLYDRFRQDRIHLADIDGTGTTDVLYVGCDGVKFYLNQAGNGWSAGIEVSSFPEIDDLASVHVTDLFGRGTACLVWSTSLPGHAQRQVRYVDLIGPMKPYLIVSTRNNLGAESYISYASSTQFYLNDKHNGAPWATRLPFSVQAVESVENIDRISGNRFFTRYAYHHGFYDGIEREFRGFGMVEQWDTEDLSSLRDPDHNPKGTNYDVFSNVPPVLTKTWFHTGAFSEALQLQQRYELEYWTEPGSSKQGGWRALRQIEHLPNYVRYGTERTPYMMSSTEARQACRALKGAILHSEVYALDGTSEQNRPYTVSHTSYNVELMQPLFSNKYAVFMTHARESLTLTYERKLYKINGRMRADPRISHSVTLATDEFGNVLQAASITYGRRYASEDPFLNDKDREKQSHLYASYSSVSFTNAIFDKDARRLPVKAKLERYELINIKPCVNSSRKPQLISFQQLEEAIAAVADGSHDLPYEDYSGLAVREPGPYRRILAASQIIYRRDDLDGALPLGSLELLAIPYKTYELALSQRQVDTSFIQPGKLSDSEAEKVMIEDGGYCRINGDWWTQSGRTFMSPDPSHSPSKELEFAKRHYFRTWHAQDAFGARSFVEFDKYDLLVNESRDPFGNSSTVGQRRDDLLGVKAISGNDYRIMSPRLVQDPNGNRTMYSYDIHGMVVGTAVMGKPIEKLGDRLDGFEPDIAGSTLMTFFADPKSTAKNLLADSTTRFIYDVFAYYRTKEAQSPQPSVIASLTRETHVSDLEAGHESRIIISFAYFDGLGRTVQEKVQAEPGPVTALPILRRARKSDRFCQYAGDDRSICPDRWITSGWTTYNNKGMAVRKYEPFFSRSHLYETDNKLGCSPITFYDALGRAVGSVGPDHTWSKVVTDPWRIETWDTNDTVLIDNPADDPDVGDYFRRLPKREYLPTWHQQRAHDPKEPEQRVAAAKAAAHANTPSFGFLDSLGATMLTVIHKKQRDIWHNGANSDQFFLARKTLDIEGKEHEIRDNQGRLVSIMTYAYSGAVLTHTNMESGTRWTLQDINGLSLLRWDGREQRVRPVYDKLRRMTKQYLKVGKDREVNTTRTIYGEETYDPQQRNFRGQIVKVIDQSGITTMEDYSFKGNLLGSKRQLVAQFKDINDVSGDMALENTIYTNKSSYDALNRQISATAPDGSLTRYVFNITGQMQQLSTRLKNAAIETTFVKEIEYDARGMQIRVERGNGTSTRVKYDPFNFRTLSIRNVSRSRRRRKSSQSYGATPAPDRYKVVQDMNYTYDATGNLVHSRDNAQPCLHFRGSRVQSDQRFTYDSLYRLIEAEGREHLGQSSSSRSWNPNNISGDVCQVPLDHPHNGNAMARYVERYSYDSTGNILSMQHDSHSWRSWTRQYEYFEESYLEPSQTNNRLSQTRVGSITSKYQYEGLAGKHGNMSSLPSIPELTWDYKDQLRSTSRNTLDSEKRETTWYVYDESGKRVRKVTEQQLDQSQDSLCVKETIYIGGAYEIFRTYKGPSTTRSIELELETLSISGGSDRLVLIENKLQGGDPKIPAQLMRYQYSNRQSSVSIELDDEANLISYEEYTPYGSTSYQAMQTQTEVPKRYRWTGKEKDTESGLYHNGLRYYMAGVGRWTSADPKGLVDGMNLYAYARANPITFTDPSGTASNPKTPEQRKNDPWLIPNLGFLRPYRVRKSGDLDQKILGPHVNEPLVLGHLMGVEEQNIIYKKFGGGPIDRSISGGSKPYTDLSGNQYPLRNDPTLLVTESNEKRATQLKTPVISGLESGKYADFDEWLGDTRQAWEQTAEEYNAERPNQKKLFTMINGKLDPIDIDQGAEQLKATFKERGIPLTGWNNPPDPSTGGDPPSGGTPGGSGSGSGGLAVTTAPSAAVSVPQNSAPSIPTPTASITSRVTSTLKSGVSALGSGFKSGVTSVAKNAGSYAKAGGTVALRAVAPLFSEYEDFVAAGGATALAAATGSPAVMTVASAVSAAPAAATYSLVVAPAIVGYVVGGTVGPAVESATGSHAAGVAAGALSGGAYGALVGATIGSFVPVIGTGAGAVVGGVVGAIAGGIAAW